MTGTCKLEGTVMGAAAHHTVIADWILNHQFLRIPENTVSSAPACENRYEAFGLMSYDSVSERYVTHLLDVFGARFSRTLGYGTRDGNAIRLVFEYPDGPFHTIYQWSPQAGLMAMAGGAERQEREVDRRLKADARSEASIFVVSVPLC